MPSIPDAHSDIERAWRQYAAEMDRAARAAAVAAVHEEREHRPPETMQPFRRRMALLHREIEQRHRTCARLHRRYALGLQKWSAGGARKTRPVFMATVAADLCVDSLALTLFDGRRQELLSAASDSRARAALELEASLGEGPAGDIADGAESVLVEGEGLADRWPRFGRAVAEYRIRSVVAVPLAAGRSRLGALCGYCEQPRPAAEIVRSAGTLADVLAHTVLLGGTRDPDGTPAGGIFDEAEYPSAVDLAAGIVAAQQRCTIDAALVLLRTHAASQGLALGQLARRVVRDGPPSTLVVDFPD
ncbi:GAF and ANTAR domain-containing protein [Nocardia sp. NPDC048505]|uniref:GAF and ANTAR domain-containing protein n=1 Tax=Nocardia sp. NPDC048505 TaxID=3155756 RepID=UPI0033F8C16C